MDEYIEREAAKNELLSWGVCIYHPEYLLCEDAVHILDSMPAADVAPVVHGHWETNSDRPDTLICSVCKCGFDMWKHDPHNYCPNCGAMMDIQDRGDNDEKSM